MLTMGPLNGPNLLDDKRFMITGKLDSEIFIGGNFVAIEDVIEPLGGFVFSKDSSSLPKTYFQLFPTYILVSDNVSTKKKQPVFMKKFKALSKKYHWPIISESLLKDIITMGCDFPSTVDPQYLL